jgi:signal peptidase I
MKFMGKLAGLTTLALYALSGLALLVFAIPATGFSAMTVPTGSMQPAISPGSLVIIQKTPLSQLKVGDVITFKGMAERNQTVTHRIVAVEKKDRVPFFTTKGDANSASDPQIIGGRVLGRVTVGVPFVGYIVDFMRSLWGLLLAVYVPALTIVIAEIRRLEAYYRAMRPFRLPWVRGQLHSVTTKDKLTATFQAIAVCVMIAAGIAIPVFAATATNSVVLANNTLTVEPQHVLFRRVEFQCAEDNTGEVNKLPSLVFHNPTTQNVRVRGWHVESSNGRVITFGPRTVFDKRDDYDIEPDLAAGVKYAGDFLALFDANNKLVDAISWGTDTSHLDPALPAIQDGSAFRRFSLLLDTNTNADWAVSVDPCSVSE